MTMRYLKGQEATEFVLISVLVFFSALLVVFIFGGKISNFFTQDSAAVKVSQKATSVINPGSSQKYNSEIENYTPPAKTTGVPASSATSIPAITENEDGSISFSASGQNVTLPAQMKDLSNAVFETTGSSGTQDLIKEIAYMVEKYKAEFPNGDVPLEITFGNGIRELGKSYETYIGTAEANSISLKAGNHVVVLQKDQSCLDSIEARQYTGTCGKLGTYRIEGDIIENKNAYTGEVYYRSMQGQVTSTVNSYVEPISIYSIDPSQGLKMTGVYNGYTWNLDLSKKFNI